VTADYSDLRTKVIWELFSRGHKVVHQKRKAAYTNILNIFFCDIVKYRRYCLSDETGVKGASRACRYVICFDLYCKQCPDIVSRYMGTACIGSRSVFSARISEGLVEQSYLEFRIKYVIISLQPVKLRIMCKFRD
jgi:hypothetical protein